MKKLVLLCPALLALGCGEKPLTESAIERALEKAVELESLKHRNDLYYLGDKRTPYSGWIKELYESGQAKSLSQIKDGKPHGGVTWWHENGEKGAE